MHGNGHYPTRGFVIRLMYSTEKKRESKDESYTKVDVDKILAKI
jgi:hypothetical protein